VERSAAASLSVPDDLRDPSQTETHWVAQSHYSERTDQGFMGRENSAGAAEFLPICALKKKTEYWSLFFESVSVGVAYSCTYFYFGHASNKRRFEMSFEHVI